MRLYELLASKKKIYIVLEFVTGGELFNKVSRNGKLKESDTRKYFQQLIEVVSYCHSKGVYHRYLKPENVLLDANGNVKIYDFGLCALLEQFREDGLLHTTCGSPNYVAPEVISGRGYNGAPADVWSSSVILFVLLTGWFPFDNNNLAMLYYKIFKSDFKFPKWLSAGALKLIRRILDLNLKTRISIAEIVEGGWFKQGYSRAKFVEENTCLDDVDVAFTNSEDHMYREETGSILMNAFQLIAMSGSLDLSGFFEEKDARERKTIFTSMYVAKDIMQKIEETTKAMRFQVERKNSKLNSLHIDPKSKENGHLSIAMDFFEVISCLHVVELRKTVGDTGQFKELCRKLSSDLSLQEDITCGKIEVEKLTLAG